MFCPFRTLIIYMKVKNLDINSICSDANYYASEKLIYSLESQIFRFGRQKFFKSLFFLTPKSKDLGLQPGSNKL